MNLRDFTALAIKISGIVLLVIVASKLPEYFKAYLLEQAEMISASIWHYIVPLLIPSIVALLLITFPYKVSDSVLTKYSDSSNLKDLEGLEIIAYRFLGLLLLYWAVSDLVFHVSNYIMLKSLSQQQFPVSDHNHNYPYLIATIAEFAFAFWLLSGTKNVINILRRIRRL